MTDKTIWTGDEPRVAPYVTFSGGKMKVDLTRYLATDAGREMVKRVCSFGEIVKTGG